MPTKTKPTAKVVKATVKKTATKPKSATKKPAVKGRSGAKSATKKPTAKARTTKKRSPGLMQSVKKGVQAGIDSMGDLVKKVTPDALLPKSAKAKRK